MVSYSSDILSLSETDPLFLYYVSKLRQVMSSCLENVVNPLQVCTATQISVANVVRISSNITLVW